MDNVARAKLQIRLVIASYRSELRRGNLDATDGFRDRALSILAVVEQRRFEDPDVVLLLADARRELDESGPS